MRNIYAPLIAAIPILFLAGCGSSQPPSIPTAAAPTSSPTATAEPPLLATADDAGEAIQTGPNDDRKPKVSFYTVLNAGEAQFVSDSTTPVVGPAAIRVSCASEGATPITVAFTPAGGEATTFEAPCGEATTTSTGFATSQGEPFEISTTWEILLTSENRAAAAVGIIRD